MIEMPVRMLRANRNAGIMLTIVLVGLSLGAAQAVKDKLARGKTVHPADRRRARSQLSANGGYVGSKACAQCHFDVYKSYLQTDMGRSMLRVDATLLSKIPITASIFDQKFDRHFELSVRQGNLYQSEYQLAADGKEVFRDTRKIDWIMGAGANGIGAIVQRGDYLFEAPLSFYSNINGWALSPGYEYGDYGFSRVILPGCVSCHSGHPQMEESSGKFQQPPFAELAIGCENCHGPGAAHVEKMTEDSIVNPAKLTPWLADNICMPCHQTGDARVLRPGKQFSDFRPGTNLDDTLGIFMVPFDRATPPQDDLLEHNLSMRLSKCYRSSAGKMSCLSCHDPHVQPAREKVAEYFRPKCLACHTEQSCGIALETRQHESPPDDCVGCHMPKRDVKVISHSVLTNHRIVVEPGEPFPDAAFQMTTPELPDLVQLSAPPGKPLSSSSVTVLQAYREVMYSHPGYRERSWALAKELEAAYPENVSVLETMADFSMQPRDREAAAAAIHYLDLARKHGSNQPADFEVLAQILLVTGDSGRAIEVLRQGVESMPYNSDLYRQLASLYVAVHQKAAACEVLTRASRLFPQDNDFRSRVKECATGKPKHTRLQKAR